MNSLSLLTDKETKVKKGWVPRLRSHDQRSVAAPGLRKTGTARTLNLHCRQQDPASGDVCGPVRCGREKLQQRKIQRKKGACTPTSDHPQVSKKLGALSGFHQHILWLDRRALSWRYTTAKHSATFNSTEQKTTPETSADDGWKQVVLSCWHLKDAHPSTHSSWLLSSPFLTPSMPLSVRRVSHYHWPWCETLEDDPMTTETLKWHTPCVFNQRLAMSSQSH